MKCEVKDDKVIVKLGVYLERENFSAQIECLQQAISYNKPIIFQANELSQIDTSALQVILSFVHELTNKNITWEWDHPSQVLLTISELLGVKIRLKINNH